MNSVRCLLMGSAAGLMAVSAAQAADLPVKAAPVEYVKVCNIYGAGFWYVPGTDTCMKIGTWVRAEFYYGGEGDGGVAMGSSSQTSAGRFTRTDTSFATIQSRALVTVDARTQTEYGTLRSYMDVGARLYGDARWPNAPLSGGNTTTAEGSINTSYNNNNVDASRAFIQFAGFTAGRIRSLYDINAPGAYTLSNNRTVADTADPGIFSLAYTAQFGGGISFSLAIEDPGATSVRARLTTDMSQFNWGGANLGAGQSLDNSGANFWDPVVNLRIDQSWGYAAISGAMQNDGGGYYNNAIGSTNTNFANTTAQGHPGDVYGWAGSAGFLLTDFLGLKGDTFAMQGNYGHGATAFVTKASGTWFNYGGSGKIGYGTSLDGVFANGTGISQSTEWAAWAAYEHFWTPRLHTAIQGGLVGITYDQDAKNLMCAGAPGFTANPHQSLGFSLAGSNIISGNCNPNYGWYQVGTRTIWNPHPDLDIGLEVLYTGLETANRGATIQATAASGGLPPGQYTFGNTGAWTGAFRIQRNFLP